MNLEELRSIRLRLAHSFPYRPLAQVTLAVHVLTHSLSSSSHTNVQNSDLLSNITDLLENCSTQRPSLTALVALSSLHLATQSHNKLKQVTSKGLALINSLAQPRRLLSLKLRLYLGLAQSQIQRGIAREAQSTFEAILKEVSLIPSLVD